MSPEVQDLHAAMLRRTDLEALESEKKVLEYNATNVARRLSQRALRANPTPEFMIAAVPLLMRALLDERVDIVARAALRIMDLEKKVETLNQQIRRQVQIIDSLYNPAQGKGS